MGKCFYLWNIYGNNIGFIAVVLFISSINFEKSSSFYDYTSVVSTSDLTIYNNQLPVRIVCTKNQRHINSLNVNCLCFDSCKLHYES